MQSFADFIVQTGHVSEKHRPYFQQWVKAYTRFAGTEKIDGRLLADFLSSLISKYQDWQIKQARQALQLYSYYWARNGLTRASPHGPADEFTARSPRTEGNTGNAPLQLPSARVAGFNWTEVHDVLVRIMRLKHLSLKTEKS